MIYLGVEYGTKFTLEGPGRTGATNTNLVPNASFESGATTGWQDGGGGVTVNTLAVNTEWSSADLRSLHYKATNNESTAKFAQLRTLGGTSGIPVTAGETYALKLTVKVLSVAAGTTPKFGVVWSTAAGAFLSEVKVLMPAATGSMTLETTLVAPATAAFAAVQVMDESMPKSSVFDVYIDAVQFEKSATPAPVFAPTFGQVAAGDITWGGTEWASAATYKQHARATFNDSTDPDYVGILDPESSGLDAPEIREDSNDRVESDGSIFGDFFSGKRPVVLQGRIIASSKTQRAERIGKLRAASLAKTSDATLWWEDPLAGKVFINLRRQQPLRITKGWMKEFQLSMVSADSRILSYGVQTVSAKGITTGSQEKTAPTNAENLNFPLLAFEFTNPTNARVSDNVYSTISFPLEELGAEYTTTLLGVWGYGFTIPSTSIPVGVEVKVEHKASVANKGALYSVIINRNATTYPGTLVEDLNNPLYGGAKYVNKDFTLKRIGTTDEVFTVGGPSDTWLYTKWLTPTIVNNSTFGAVIQYVDKGSSTLSVDSVAIKITYAEPLKVTATNEGDAPSPAIIKVKGPLENFYVLNQTTGEILTYNAKVESGKEIWFDTENVTVTEHGTGITEPINRFANVGLPNDWIKVWPGANTILVAGLGGNTNTEVLVEYRYAWE